MLFQTPTMMVFPGQGSQRLGMLQDYAEAFSVVKQTFDEVSQIYGQDLWGILQNGPKEKLDDTRITQPIMFASDIAIWRVWQACGGAKPEMVAGHSLGEYAALVCAEVLSFEDAAQLVCHRGRLMADTFAEGEGAVGVVIKATQPEVEAWCKACSKPGNEVAIANINSPIQLVVAGHKAAVEEVLQLAKQNQAKMARLLPVSVPVHCQLMQPTAEAFQNYFADVTFHQPKIPVVFNVDALCHLKVEHIQKALYEQLFKPVQWVKTMDVMMQNKPGRIVESGPGGVLTGLLKRTFSAAECEMISLNNLTELQEICGHGS